MNVDDIVSNKMEEGREEVIRAKVRDEKIIQKQKKERKMKQR